jgi:hypothetical protein
MDVSKYTNSSNHLSYRNFKVLWLLNYEGKHITLGQTLNEVTDDLTKRIKGTIQATDMNSRKTRGGRTRNEFFKVEISVRNLPVRY